jgi:exo-1,4-beta-D-glucosaminidase
MKKALLPTVWIILAAHILPGAQTMRSGTDRTTSLDAGWQVQSADKVPQKGETISTAAFTPVNWYPATVPSTIVGVLLENKVYPDPFFGMNLRSIPGTTYRIATNFSNSEMRADSPFRGGWWYRRQFIVEKNPQGTTWLHFDGINFRANIWFNGRSLADSKQVAGAYRTYDFNVTDLILAGTPNVVAVEVFPPEATDLALTWVDWNPMPPDKNMGIWRDVYLTSTPGPVTIKHPYVVTKLDQPSLASARLTVKAELHNAAGKPVQATLKGQIEKVQFSQAVTLGPGETKSVTFSPDQHPQLQFARPRLWWPIHLGAQNLYRLTLQAQVEGKASDGDTVQFGIREVTSELNEQKFRVFKVNGKPVLIRGAGWAPDMLLRPSKEREIAEIQYVKDMNLNTIRFEGRIETHRFLDMLDRAGILSIAGWCCCDHWEHWDKWDEEDHVVAAESLRDQVRLIRRHPSVITWWYGSDGPPPAKVEEAYIQVLKAEWPNPYQSSATAKPSALTEATGLKMNGPYEYVPPSYWYVDRKRGGAHGFGTEISPGPAVPPVESLRRMLPRDHLWPINEYWNFHAGGGAFKDIAVFTDALKNRYGTPRSLEDYAMKAQLMAYEGERAMFEAFGRNKYTSTGVIQWMLNNAWPSLIWHLYDYYLRPAGGYFGTKKACEPLHIQYSYDDRSVVIVNSYYREFKGLKVEAKIYDLGMAEKFSKNAAVDVQEDSSTRVFAVPEGPEFSTTYFLDLRLKDAVGKELSSNFYWLSTSEEILDEAKSTWYYTPVKVFADYTELKHLPQVTLPVSTKFETRGREQFAHVTLENPGKALAFFVRLKATEGQGGDEILPVIWQDNYFSLLPGERREITARYALPSRPGKVVIEVEGWNVARAFSGPRS